MSVLPSWAACAFHRSHRSRKSVMVSVRLPSAIRVSSVWAALSPQGPASSGEELAVERLGFGEGLRSVADSLMPLRAVCQAFSSEPSRVAKRASVAICSLVMPTRTSWACLAWRCSPARPAHLGRPQPRQIRQHRVVDRQGAQGGIARRVHQTRCSGLVRRGFLGRSLRGSRLLRGMRYFKPALVAA